MTYADLLWDFARVSCSCCGTDTDIGGALMAIDDEDRVHLVPCDTCGRQYLSRGAEKVATG
jgi:formate dehydrogenase maturation protein FdhE